MAISYFLTKSTKMPQKPILSAQYKATPKDFIVTEIMPIANHLTNTGEHLWIFVEKIGVNTTHLVKLLAAAVQITPNDVGYSGLKDRQAVTYQWFSLRLPKTDDIAFIEKTINNQLNANEKIAILSFAWHTKKLNRGTHTANQFCITLRQVVGDVWHIDDALSLIRTTGVPNYFGEQRFGHNHQNLTQAKSYFEKLLKTKNIKRKLNQKESFLISAVRSHLFNLILQKRVENGTWNQAIDGDVFGLNGSHSLFLADIDDEIRHRIAIGDIHPTAPLFGIQGKLVASDTAHAIEQTIFDDERYAQLVQGLLKLGIRADRRALRAMLTELNWVWQDDGVLVLNFALPTGSFATSVLDWLVQELVGNPATD